VPLPDVIVVVATRRHLERNLFLAGQVLELGLRWWSRSTRSTRRATPA
jgi:Fe2+ transport system protein B